MSCKVLGTVGGVQVIFTNGRLTLINTGSFVNIYPFSGDARPQLLALAHDKKHYTLEPGEKTQVLGITRGSKFDFSVRHEGEFYGLKKNRRIIKIPLLAKDQQKLDKAKAKAARARVTASAPV